MTSRFSDPNIWCIVGLGNPGREYGNTRHNLGFSVVNQLATRSNLSWRYKPKYSFTAARDAGFFLMRPLTYMNLSGQAVKQCLQEKGLSTERLLVICDDINLPLGQLRLRASGSHGGQKGLKSVIETLKNDQFARLRLGIGPLPNSESVSDFVLGKFTRQEYPSAREMIDKAADSVEKIINLGLEKAMNSINQKNT
jgi:PTH1 family peptidyl-tRNA hydrolase